MAFADLGSLGATGNTNNNQASLVLTTTAAVAVGELVVVVVAVDNRVSGGGDDLAVSGVTNSGTANTWTKAIQVANNVAAQGGASCSIWYTVATAAMASGATITAAFTLASTSDATAMTARHFSMGAGMTAQIEGTPGTLLHNTALDPGALDVTTANIACLRIRGIAIEMGATTALTPTASWTAWAGGQSATTGTTAEMAARAEHRIVAGTTASSNPTLVSAINANAYVAFKEVSLLQTLTVDAVHTNTSNFYAPKLNLTLAPARHDNVSEFFAPTLAIPEPTITTAADWNNPEGTVLAIPLTADQTDVTWSLLAFFDAGQFTITGTTLGWSGPPYTRSYGSPADADANNVYGVVIVATNSWGEQNKVLTVTVQLGVAAQDLAPPLLVNTDMRTQLLLHFDGNLADSSGFGRTTTAAGAAAVDSQNVFSLQSLKLTAEEDYVQVDGIEVFGTDDFCIDLRARLSSATVPQVFYNGGAGGPRLSYDGTALKYEGPAGVITGSGLAADTNYHIAVTRAGTSTRLWLDGVQQGSTLTDAMGYAVTSGYPQIGGALAPAGPVELEPTFTVSHAYTADYTGHTGDGSGLRDGNYVDPSSSWMSQNYGPMNNWIVADLGADVAVLGIGIAPITGLFGDGPGFLNGSQVDIATAAAPSSFTWVTDITGCGENALTFFEIEQTCRYIRITRNANYWTSVSEFRVYS